MTPEHKRGIKHPDGFSKREAQKVGPYPPWDSWKHNLYNKFPSLDHSLPENVKIRLEGYYNIRRLFQQGIDQSSQLTVWMNEVEQLLPSFFEKYNLLIRFIKDKTEVPPEVFADRLSRVRRGNLDF